MVGAPLDDLLDDDGELVPAKVGEQLEAFRERLSKMIYFRMDPRIRGRVDIADVLQDSFLEVHERLPEFLANPEVPFFVWVRFLAAQRLAQLHRHHLGVQMRDARREIPLHIRAAPEVSSLVLAEALVKSGTSPSQALMRDERRELVAEVLDSLGEIDREILVLRHLEGLGNLECARILELQESAASRRYLRAATRFSESLSRRVGDD